MSPEELADIRRLLGDIRDRQAATATDVKWIKDALEKGGARMDAHEARVSMVEKYQHAHEARIHKVETHQQWFSTLAASIGALMGVGGNHLFKS